MFINKWVFFKKVYFGLNENFSQKSVKCVYLISSFNLVLRRG